MKMLFHELPPTLLAANKVSGSEKLQVSLSLAAHTENNNVFALK